MNSAGGTEREQTMEQRKQRRIRRLTVLCVLLVLIPLSLGMGVWLFADKQYRLITGIVAVLSCIPFFLRFEKGKTGVGETVTIAVMTAFSVIGRVAFSPVPGFKPVTAITIIAGIALGPEAGFLVGSLSAVVSNLFFGQGPWTPFQMFAWGITGFLAGVCFFRRKKPNRVMLAIVGIVGGVLFSLLMDIWTALSIDGAFLPSRYLACILSSFPFMAIYAVSNVVFLQLLATPFLEKLNRMKVKYGLFSGRDAEP